MVTTMRNVHNHGQYAHYQITSIDEQQAHNDKIPGFCHIQHVPRSTYAVLRGNFTELPQDLLNYLRIY